MPNVTLQVIIDAPNHPLSGMKGASRLRRGDIIGVHLSNDVATRNGPDYNMDSIGSPRTGFVHMKDAPPAAKLKERFLEQLDGDEEYRDDGLGGGPRLVGYETVRRHKWKLKISDLPTGQRNALLNDKEFTVQWTNIRPRIRRKVFVDKLDPTQDDDSNAVQDSEVQ